jgi:hypothetical protein
LTPAWSGAGGAASGNTYSFQAVAGQSYTVGLSTSGGVGWYGITVTSTGTVANAAPVLGAIGNRSVNEGSALDFTATATDANSGQSLTYSLGAGAPAGASINATTGAFSWTPTTAQGPASYNVTVIVTDNGSPALNDSETFSITVNEPSAPTTEHIRFISATSNSWLWGGGSSWVYTTNSDIVKLTMNDTSYRYSMFFNGADAGLTTSAEGVDAFTFLSDGSILVSTVGSFSVSTNYSAPGVGSGAVLTGGGGDILRFVPTTVGDNTTGTWSFYFDGSDVGLSGSSENIDALSVLMDGRLVISTSGGASVPGVSAADEDLLVFGPSLLGAATAGTWSMYFDGSDVGLSSSDEDIDAVFVCATSNNPNIFISTRGNFAVPGNAGANEDVFAFHPSQLGSATSGSFMPYMVLDGSYYGLPQLDVEGFFYGPAPGPLQGNMALLASQVSSPNVSLGLNDYALQLSDASDSFAHSNVTDAGHATDARVSDLTLVASHKSELPTYARVAAVGARSLTGSQFYFDGLDSDATAGSADTKNGQPLEFEELIAGKHDLLALDYLFSTVEELF